MKKPAHGERGKHHNPQTFEDEQFSRDAAGLPTFPPRECVPCPICKFEDHEVCKLLGHVYPIGSVKVE